MRRRAIVMLALLSAALSGCAAIGPTVTGIATAGVAGTVGSATGSALFGAIAGVGVAYGADQGVKYVERRIHENVQITIADAAGPLEVGEGASWHVDAKLPFSGRSGTLEVARAFGDVIPCKEIIFTVDDDHNVYTTTVCLNDQGNWTWAAAEPSTHRWGPLQ